jgi:lon-related putative ATP-dependent protease
MPLVALHPSQLRRSTDPTAFTFNTTADVTPLVDIIGQPRGTQAIEFGIDIASPGYNIFVLGEEGTGRTPVIKQFLNNHAAQRPVPQDWMYVNNFADPLKPRALNLPPSFGRQLRNDMTVLVENLIAALPQAFEQTPYLEARNRARLQYELEREALFDALQNKAAALDLTIVRDASGLVIRALRDDKPLTSDEYKALPAEERSKIDSARHQLESELESAIRASQVLEQKAKADRVALDQQVAASVVDVWLDELKAKYAAYEETVLYLNEVRRDIVENVDEFLPPAEPSTPPIDPKVAFRKYTINLVIDHSNTQGAPVVLELNATYPKLFGRIEYESRLGTLFTDFTLIRIGALHAANGGYLILRVHDVFADSVAWEALKRSLFTGFVRTEDVNRATPTPPTTKTLEPEPIPLDLKVVLIGPPHAYYDLNEYDEGFRALFKVKADFAYEMTRTSEAERQYAGFIAARCTEEGLRPFDRGAVARVIDFGARAAGDQEKLSVRFSEVANLVREANYWAGKAGRDVVTVDDVRCAIDQFIYRANKNEQIQRERILEGSVFIDTKGEALGQLNGLSVIDPGDYGYGLPTRVSVRTSVGHGGVSHLDRDTGMAGQIHNKGLLTLSSYFSATYASTRSVSFAAQITFEQNYSGIEGDSASAAELCALLSNLSGYPVKQGLAITGSVNQKGDIQPIGGVNEKIEGFFGVCDARGLTGEQGVIIPQSNVRDLMLNDKVIAAAEQGLFHIYAVTTIDEAIELFTGVKAGGRTKDGRWPEKTVHSAVQKRLRELNKGHERDEDEEEERKAERRKRERRRPPPPKKPIKRLPPKAKKKAVKRKKSR